MDTAVQTPSGRLHWIMDKAAKNMLLKKSYAIDDDVMEIIVAFLNYDAILPFQMQTHIMDGPAANSIHSRHCQ